MIHTVTLALLLLSWRDRSTNETEFVIERAAMRRCAWVEVARVPADVTSYLDTGSGMLRPCYRVRATNEAGSSKPSPARCEWEVRKRPKGPMPRCWGVW